MTSVLVRLFEIIIIVNYSDKSCRIDNNKILARFGRESTPLTIDQFEFR